jgi:hypothetical protein
MTTALLEAEGVSIDQLPVGTQLDVETASRTYHLELLPGGEASISGHPKYCPQPVRVKLFGSSFGLSALRMHFLGMGMNLEFQHPVYGVVHTSRIVDVRQAKP